MFSKFSAKASKWAVGSCGVLMALIVTALPEILRADPPQVETRQPAITEYLVFGTVLWVDTASSSITIRGSSLLAYLHIRVRSYRVKQPSALMDLRPGEAITAVFSTKDGMLHRLRHVRRKSDGPSLK
jgi:hypothetical protein